MNLFNLLTIKPQRYCVYLMICIVLFAVPGTVFAADADDPFYEKQEYLKVIGVPKVWDTSTSNQDIVIAVVDTGVDLTHPDLMPNLVPGVNLIQPEEPPQDDHGHGTSVAGVIGSEGNNDRGVAGILWNAKIMPVKALSADGEGGEQMLGQGIRYAVDNGAKIIVLSLGLNKYSDYMKQIVEYAEQRNVLLVGAAGNEGASVKYPAAYPTVLAVGGVSMNGGLEELSNSGPELDLVAPWNVFTTAIGGGYEYRHGTSMAAPQVAAVAAHVWKKYPSLTASELRSHLKRTAKDMHTPGWDAVTGFGMLQADRALNESYVPDFYEPNNRKDQAKALSVAQSTRGSFAGSSDSDWFYLDAPYSGTVYLRVRSEFSDDISVQHTNADGKFSARPAKSDERIALTVTKGRSYVQLQLLDRSIRRTTSYELTTEFLIYTDPYEDNDRQFQAYKLKPGSQTVTGTLHQNNDVDWFELPVPVSGSLRIWLMADTARMDLVLTVQKQGEKAEVVDKHGDGATEMFAIDEVFPGSVFIRVNNVSEYENPIMGEYKLRIEYEARLVDPNEPNNRSYQATPISLDAEYNGLLDKVNDQDWFQFRLTQKSLASLDIGGIPEGTVMELHLYDSSIRSLGAIKNKANADFLQWKGLLEPGVYFVRLSADQAFTNQMYGLKASAQPLTEGYIDIRGHWAEQAIVKLSKDRVFTGYGDYTFRPDQPLTRAEAVAVLVRHLKLSQQGTIAYSDVKSTHWAYKEIALAVRAGIVQGYPDGTFAPDQPVTRMEMSAMLARGLKMAGTASRGNHPFSDVNDQYWGAALLRQLAQEGLIGGYPDGTFRPERQAARAEWAQLVASVKRS